MKTLLLFLRDLALFRRGPQDFPYSKELLVNLALATFVLDAATVSRSQPIATAVASAAIALACLAGLPRLALKLANKDARYVQTATALLGVSLLFTLVAIPLVVGIGTMPQKPEDVTGGQMLLLMTAFFLAVWQIAVRGHILRHALDLPMRLGVVIAIVFVIVELIVSLVVFGGRSA